MSTAGLGAGLALGARHACWSRVLAEVPGGAGSVRTRTRPPALRAGSVDQDAVPAQRGSGGDIKALCGVTTLGPPSEGGWLSPVWSTSWGQDARDTVPGLPGTRP